MIERLGVGDVQRARTAFTMMHGVFDEDPEELSDGFVASLLANDSFWAIAAFETTQAIGCITGHELAMTHHEHTELFVAGRAALTPAPNRRRCLLTTLLMPAD